MTSLAIADPAATRPAKSARGGEWLLLVLVWISSGLYAASLLDRGWVPHDEGAIAQSAQRTLAGQLPHRDFNELYTGGLSYLNAASFRLFGENLLAPRIVLYLFFLAWLPVVYQVARRFSTAAGAAALTLLAAVWSVPNYSAALPSWYNLFFATFGLAAVLRFLDTSDRRWLFVAGICCGVSFLFKLSGIYFAAGVVLFLVFLEQDWGRDDPRGQRPQAGVYSAFVVFGMSAFVVGIMLILRHHGRAVVLVEYLVPALALACLCVLREFAGVPGRPARRFSTFFRLLLPFALGAVLPILLFLIPYIRAGALQDFIAGVFILPGRRLDFASRQPVGFSLHMILTTVVVTGLMAAAYRNRLRALWVQLAVAVLLVTAFILSKTHPKVFVSLWAPLLLLIPLSTLAAVWILMNPRVPPLSRRQVMLLVSVTATCTLIQFPFSARIYFCYIAPLLALSLGALFSVPARVSRPVLGMLLAFYFAFAVFRVTPSFLHAMAYFYQPDPETEPLRLPRAGGLRIDRPRAIEYERLIPEIQAHAGPGEYIYAGPDCPEVYFLAGKRNPTRTMFEFLEDPGEQTARVLRAIDTHQVEAVVVYSSPEFSRPLPPELLAALREHFPQAERIGQFEVRWRR